VAGLSTTKCGDMRYFNNIFVGGIKEKRDSKTGLGIYERAELPMIVDGNIYLNKATAFKNEKNQVILNYDPQIKMEEKEDGVFLTLNLDKQIFRMKNKTVKSELLGKAIIPDLPFENPDGTPIIVEKDYFGNQKNKKNPAPGPFENPGNGKVVLKVWEK
jgi:alpha-N-arabinofuranosidase